MPHPDTLIVIHYHLLPGGVCSAIKNSLLALSRSGWLSNRALQVLTGRKAGVEEFLHFLNQWDIQVQIEVDPRLDYSDRVWPDRDKFYHDVSALADWFLGQAQEVSLFWAHNPTLGKNPLVTAALMAAGQKAVVNGAPHRFLYHIHDFAECGRLWNLNHLRTCWGSGGLEDFYPSASHFYYAVLNTADSKRLAQAGVPTECIFRLPNAVPSVYAAREKEKESIALELERYAGENGYRFEWKRPWWTLPIRLIRRKNVLEALLLAATADDPPQLLVTLDANSEPERPYAEAVKDLFRRKNHAAVVGFGHELVGHVFGFDDLLLASDVVATTSLLEGFGFSFLEGANRGRPLVGRDLYEVTSDFVESGFPAGELYDQFLVPVSRKVREQMVEKGRQFAQREGQLLKLDKSTIHRFSLEVETIFSEDAVDFGFLELDQQIDLTLRLQDDSFVKDLKSLNQSAAEPALFPADFNKQVAEQFGLKPHALRLATAFEAMFTQRYKDTEAENVSDNLLGLYFLPRYHRPLVGGW
ncbi:MAG: hypothetical protein PVF76_08070 [Syntrophobacterales bacterium]|jgi:hypothetical protein